MKIQVDFYKENKKIVLMKRPNYASHLHRFNRAFNCATTNAIQRYCVLYINVRLTLNSN